MAATSVMSDRICIHTKAKLQPQISSQDLIECCPHCGGYIFFYYVYLIWDCFICRGTVWALFSFVHWKEHGIVTGKFFFLVYKYDFAVVHVKINFYKFDRKKNFFASNSDWW